MLHQGVSGITDLITTPGLINLDFADVKSVMSDAGSALMGIGSRARRPPRRGRRRDGGLQPAARGLDRRRPRRAAVDRRRLRPRPVRDQRGRRAGRRRRRTPDANIIFGAVIDDALGDEVRVTVIAAGFDGGEPKVRDASQPALLKETPADTPPTAESYLSSDPLLDGQSRSPCRPTRAHRVRRRPRHPRLPALTAFAGARVASRCVHPARRSAARRARVHRPLDRPERPRAVDHDARRGRRAPPASTPSPRCTRCTAATSCGSTWRALEPKADALLTDVVGLGLLVRVADCVPVVLAVPDERFVGVVHCGRQGLVAGVVPAAVDVVRERGADPHRGVGRARTSAAAATSCPPTWPTTWPPPCPKPVDDVVGHAGRRHRRRGGGPARPLASHRARRRRRPLHAGGRATSSPTAARATASGRFAAFAVLRAGA